MIGDVENPLISMCLNNHKLAMTGNGKHTTYKNADLGDGLAF